MSSLSDLNCSQAENRDRLDLQDPRGWYDKKGRTPKEAAKLRKNEEMAAILDPAAEIQLFSLGSTDNSVVPKLQVFAAALFQKQLLASIQEAEEFMKLLGTHQTHGRVFARLAYNSEQTTSSTDGNVYETYANTPPAVRETLMKEHLAGRRYGPSTSRPISSNRSSDAAIGPSSSASPMRGVLASMSYQGGRGPTLNASLPQTSTTYTQDSSKSSPSDELSQPKKSGSGARAETIKEWLSYDAHRRLNDRGVGKARVNERSTLAQQRSEDQQGCMATTFFCFGGPKADHRAPMVGEDVCGLCRDNKPLLQMMRCEHRICLLCAKSMTYLLDMQQLVLCPYCGDIVESFGLA